VCFAQDEKSNLFDLKTQLFILATASGFDRVFLSPLLATIIDQSSRSTKWRFHPEFARFDPVVWRSHSWLQGGQRQLIPVSTRLKTLAVQL